MTAPRPPAANPDELFDVVDAQDRVIGQAPRGEVHAKHLIHRATHVLLHDTDGRLLLQRRSPGKDTFPNCWDSSCSGHLDSGEDYPEAARRELGEELGYFDENLALRPIVKLTTSPETGYEFIQIYLLGPTSGPFDPNPAEITETRWVTVAELDDMIRKTPEIFASALRLLWSKHRAEILRGIS